MRHLLLAATIAIMAMGCTKPGPAAQTAAQFPTCSPLVWLVDNLVVLTMPASGGWAVNGQPVDSARLAIELPAIYFAHRRRVFQRDGMWMDDSALIPRLPGEEVEERTEERERPAGDQVGW